jgi:hypothetical protein
MPDAKRAPIWHHAFSYRDTAVQVTRERKWWRVRLGADVGQGRTMVDAFEALLGTRVQTRELGVVVAALAWDDVHSRNGAAPVPERL